MNNYIKKVIGDKIIFKDIKSNTELVVSHYNDKNSFDSIFIDEEIDFEFLKFIIENLKGSNDLSVIFSLYDSSKLEKFLYNYGLRVSNYQYIIKCKDYAKINRYDVSNKLEDESKKFYLDTINNLSKINQKYFDPNRNFTFFDETWFNNDEFMYRIYRKNGKLVGIVDYKVFEDDFHTDNTNNKIFNYNNRLCVRCLLCANENIIEDIIKDLMNTYNKDIVINILYTEPKLKETIRNLDGIFNYCQYTLVNTLDDCE